MYKLDHYSRFISSLAGYPLLVKSSVCVCVMCLKEYDTNINYYHYQPGSNIIIVYFKHITHTVVII